MRNNFLKCGITGWCLEVIWTGFGNYFNHDKKMTGNTSILMFPIYGSAAFLKPLMKFIGKMNMAMRGSIYTICIFATEYCAGSFLKKINRCPWDYSDCRHNIKGVVRLDYAPAWFITGLIFEKLLNPSKVGSH